MKKTEIVNTLQEVLRTEAELPPAQTELVVRQFVHRLEEAEAQAAAQREAPVRQQYVIAVADPRGELPPAELVGWVLQVPEHENPATALERLIRAAHHFNASPRGRRHPVRSIGEAAEAVPNRLLKEQRLAVKTKLPVQVVVTDNRLAPLGDGWSG